MPNPTRRFSKTRTLKRRTHDKATDPTVAVCSNCGAPVLYHRVCPECGYYKGKPAIDKTETTVEAKKDTKKEPRKEPRKGFKNDKKK